MRSGKTTNIFSLVAILFIVTIIILCFTPPKHQRDSFLSSQQKQHGHRSDDDFNKTSRRLPLSPNNDTFETSTSQSTPTTLSITDYGRVCDTSACKRIASKMLDSSDHRIQPCQNFYAHSCGGIESDPFLTVESAEDKLNSILLRQMTLPTSLGDASQFFDSCVEYFSSYETAFIMPNLPQLNEPFIPEEQAKTRSCERVSNLLAEFLKHDVVLLFDVKLWTDWIKYDEAKPVLLISLPNEGNSLAELKGDDVTACSNRLHSKRILSDNWHLDVKETLHFYKECMSTTGVKIRMNRLKQLQKEQLFQKKSNNETINLIYKNDVIENFFREIQLKYPTQKTEVTKRRERTLAYLKETMGHVINWDTLLTALIGLKLEDHQKIFLESEESIISLLEVINNNRTCSDIVEIMKALALEKMSLRPESSESYKDISKTCLHQTRYLLPDDTAVIFAQSFSKEQKQNLSIEIKNLGSEILFELMRQRSNSPFTTELDQMHKMKQNIKMRQLELNVTDAYKENVRKLQQFYRKKLYKLFNKPALEVDDCRYLSRNFKISCYKQWTSFLIPMTMLVPPNLYLDSELPSYLRLAGVAHYMAESLSKFTPETGLHMDGYNDKQCFDQSIRSLQLTHRKNTQRNFTITENDIDTVFTRFRALNVAWSVISKSTGAMGGSHSAIIWLGAKPLPPIKAFLIHYAQRFCQANNNIDIFDSILMKSNLPQSFWVNALIQTDPVFSKPFSCSHPLAMTPKRMCLDTKQTQPPTTTEESLMFPVPSNHLKKRSRLDELLVSKLETRIKK